MLKTRFGAGNKEKAFKCQDCQSQFAPGEPRYFDNYDHSRRPLCSDCKDSRSSSPFIPGIQLPEIRLPADFWTNLEKCLISAEIAAWRQINAEIQNQADIKQSNKKSKKSSNNHQISIDS